MIDDLVDGPTIGRRLVAYFETFSTADFFEELHELRSTLKLRDNFEVYLYIGELRHNKVTFPLFYLPLEISLEDRIFRVAADPHLYINKRALDYAAQETARELGRAVPILVDERIIFLPDGGTFTATMQRFVDRWTGDLALKPPVDLSDSKAQSAQRSQLAITNCINFAAFDKSDEALLNDYEELMTVLASGSDAAADFSDIVMNFLKRDPFSVTNDIEKEWDGTTIPDRLVFESPVPLNEEQRKILSAIRHANTRFVAIEGPPGTGKSHTITAMVFQAILDGNNVLVLSDKTEALDVVERKLTDVLNAVRFGDDFQNPILRLGKSGSSYGRILAAQSIEAIRSHHKAATVAETRLSREVQTVEDTLAGAIQITIDKGADIGLPEVVNVCAREDMLGELLEEGEKLVYDDTALSTLEAAGAVSALLSKNGGKLLRLLTTCTQRAHLDDLERLLALQRPLSTIMVLAPEDVSAASFFSRFSSADLPPLQYFITEYKNLRWPLFGFLFTGRKARELDLKFGEKLRPVSSLGVYEHIATLERAYSFFSKVGSQLTNLGIGVDIQALAFQQAIEDEAAFDIEAATALQAIGKIRAALKHRPELAKELSLSVEHLQQWSDTAATSEAHRLRELVRFGDAVTKLKKKFQAIPSIDYAGDKARLEGLHAQRLAHMIDGRVLDFADNHRNLSRSIRDIISKRQRFPKEQFEALKKAFPCMIAGIRDYAEYVPLEQGLFDLVIIDEASQVSIAQAFPAFVRAKKLVVLGDQKQFSNVKTSNASIEINTQYVNSIVERFRHQEDVNADIINRVKLFDIKTSVLRFVERIANYNTMLRKHFRGYPELISFSSKTFYGSLLQAVKIRGKSIDEVIRFTFVEPPTQLDTKKNINNGEYEAILEELRRLAAFDDPPSVGIITPFNEQQAYILQKLSALTDGDELQDLLDIKVMTFDSCQGEERDIIIYSMVATPLRDKLAYIFPRSVEEADEVDHQLRMQRLNVGFSRAKERIHIFHSQPIESFKNSIGKALTHYQRELDRARQRPDQSDTDAASPMEGKVLAWLQQTKFVQDNGDDVEIDAQFELGNYLRQLDPTYKHPAYRVDFLLKLNTPKRAVSIILEYDGFKEHFTNREQANAANYGDYYKPGDVERQKILEGYGYRFLRINRFNIGKDPVQTLDERLSRLAKDVLEDFQQSDIVEEVRETASSLHSGDMKVCPNCGQPKAISRFFDQSLRDGAGSVGRKCIDCKNAPKARSPSAPSSSSPRRRRRYRRW